MIELPAPIGYLHLRHAIDALFRTMFGTDCLGICCQNWLKHLIWVERDMAVDAVITIIAEACEAGKVATAYQDLFKGADDLDRCVWRLPHWRNYFATGMIEVDLPALIDGKPDPSGMTFRCERKIFVRRDDFIELMKVHITPTLKTRTHANRQGSPERYDWDDIGQFVRKEFDQRGDFGRPENRVNGWRSQNDLIELIKDYLERHKQDVPGHTQLKQRVASMLAQLRSELPADH